MSEAVSHANPSAPATGWLIAPGCDAFWLLSGLWLPLLVVALPEAAWDPIYLGAVLLLWLSHRFASAWVFWLTPEYQPARTRHGSALGLKTLLLLFLTLAWMLIPPSLLPLLPRLGLLVLIDFTLALHHFAAQHFGVLRLYASHSPTPPPSSPKRQADWWFCLGLSVFLVAFAEFLHGVSRLQEQWLNLPIPGVPHSELWLQGGMLLACLWTALHWRHHQHGSLPQQAYLLSIGGLGASAFALPPEQFLAVWTMQHWMVSVGLKSALGNRSASTSGRGHLQQLPALRRGVLWALLTLPLVPLLEFDAVPEAERLTEGWWPWLEQSMTNHYGLMGVVALGFASGWAHYLHDRAAFRMSDPVTRNCLNDLLTPKDQECPLKRNSPWKASVKRRS